MKRTVIIIISLALLTAAHAQVTLEQCHKLARENYPLIKQYALIEQSSQYTFSNLTHSWFPQVNLSAQATYQNETPSFPDKMKTMLSTSGLEMKGLARDQYRVQLDVSQKIFDGGKASSQKALTQAQDLEQKAQTDVDLYALNKRVNDLYFGILPLSRHVAGSRRHWLLRRSSHAIVVCQGCRPAFLVSCRFV